ncbi:hypothetical protein DVH24_038589 [Malus domestica]|uniref:Fe2OG dioxygenase domain-containing protein n=1 Tax=Malus domestica TaxID=3750 RepID=A0A498KEZ5_MALDO|nr:hypothetical protein DVH24_038589 [Malus domestica]
MGSLTLPKLPTIDFSVDVLKPGSSSWLSTSKQVRYALEEYGGFVAQYDQISAQLLNDIFGHAKDLFEVPLENKVKNVSNEPYRGYIGPNHLMPLYEGIAIDNVTSPEETQKFKNLIETTDSFAQLLSELEHKVEQMLFESYGAEKQYESVASANSHLLRFLKYNKPEEADSTTLRFASHTDKNFTTIVVQHDVGGLEVKTKDGDWISVESVPSQFVFLAGDGLQHCGDKTRYSLGLFTFNNGIIQVPQELVDERHPLLYNPLDSLEYIRFHSRGEARNLVCPVNTFCGVTNSAA